MPWIKLTLSVPQNKLDTTEEALLLHQVQSLTVSSVSDETFLEHTLHELPQWSHVRIEALFALHDDLLSVLTTLRALALEAPDISFVGDNEWQCANTDQSERMDFGGFWVVPRKTQVAHATNVVRLEPGLAFGTGEHPTTYMCLSWLALHPPRHLSVLDFGTGSGILGITAKILGAKQVDAIDIDPLALQTARENARYNAVEISVTEKIHARRRYDVIIANILLNTILEFALNLTEFLNPGGAILLTGLLPSQAARVKFAYTGIEFVEFFQKEEWCLLVGRRTQ